MGDNDDVEVLIKALREQTSIMSETYTATTNRMCQTIEELDKNKSKNKTIQNMIVLVIVFMFLLFFLLLYLF
jgi:uracil phosphoribosyltransferase